MLQAIWRFLILIINIFTPTILKCSQNGQFPPHSSTLAWKIPWMEQPGGLQSMGSWSRTRLSNFTFTFYFHPLEKEMETHSSVLAWRIPGTLEPGGLPSMGSHRVEHDWSDLAAAAAADRLQKMNGSTVVNLYHRIQLSSEEKQTMDACSNLC